MNAIADGILLQGSNRSSRYLNPLGQHLFLLAGASLGCSAYSSSSYRSFLQVRDYFALISLYKKLRVLSVLTNSCRQRNTLPFSLEISASLVK
jgi:hypothetical protein